MPKCIGIITVPLSPQRKYYQVCGDSYIASSHIDWLQRAGLKIVAIPYTTKKFKYYIKRVNGLYFPSGGVFASNNQKYFKCCKKFMEFAMKETDNGNYMPIWGGCMGMQQMMIIADGNDDLKNLLTKFDSFNNLLCKLKITKDGMNSRMLENIPQEFINKLQHEKCTLNNHMMGISPSRFKLHRRLNKMFKIISTSKCRKHKNFVSTIEARDYPFYGVQWHPERADDMEYLGQFFADEVWKNKQKCRVEKKYKLEFKTIDCMQFSGQIYHKCHFYWHERTSKHNRRLCDLAQLGTPGHGV
jgi:gamma-glutamyl hydrolase